MAQIALSWLLHKDWVDAPIVSNDDPVRLACRLARDVAVEDIVADVVRQ